MPNPDESGLAETMGQANRQMMLSELHGNVIAAAWAARNAYNSCTLQHPGVDSTPMPRRFAMAMSIEVFRNVFDYLCVRGT